MAYSRLTRYDKDGRIQIRVFNGSIGGTWENPFIGSGITRKAIDRLAELEDKIDSGELIPFDTVVQLFAWAFGNESPCNFGLGGESLDEYMVEHCENYCEAECGNTCAERCWGEFIKAKLKEIQGESKQ